MNDADRSKATNLAIEQVRQELMRAIEKFPPFNGGHEGYAVILEELDELWDEVKADQPYLAVQEAIQVAAMAIRFITDVGAQPKTERDRMRWQNEEPEFKPQPVLR